MNMLEANGLSFSYGEVPVLSNLSFTLPQGGFAALIGSNGVGKSTLLKLLLGELTPTSGTVRVLGEETRRFRGWPKVGYVPQDGLGGHAEFPASVNEIVRSCRPTCFPKSACSAFPGGNIGRWCAGRLHPWAWRHTAPG